MRRCVRDLALLTICAVLWLRLAESQRMMQRARENMTSADAGPLYGAQERAQYLHQFVLHASLDAVDEQLWNTTSMHLGVVDKFNNLHVRRFLSGSSQTFLVTCICLG